MDKTLNEIILEWIGEDKKLKHKECLEGRCEVCEGCIVRTVVNEVLSGLRERVPELVEKIDKVMDNELSAAMSIRDRY